MELHDLFANAVADLPDLPDQLDAAQRTHRRRRAATRAGLVAASTALVVGVGTLTIVAPWNRGASTSIGGDGPAAFPRQLIGLLQPIWPKSGETITWDPQSADQLLGVGVQPAQKYMFFKVESADGSYYLAFGFGADQQPSGDPGTPEPSVSCPPARCAGTSDWLVDAEVEPFAGVGYQVSGPAGYSGPHSLQTVQASNGPAEIVRDVPTAHLVIQDGAAMLASMTVFAESDLTVAQLKALGTTSQMHELYQDAAADSLLWQQAYAGQTVSPTPPAAGSGSGD